MNITKRKPTHPGAVLMEAYLRPLKLSIAEAARRLGVTRKHLSNVVNAKAPMSVNLAFKVAQATDSSPESWVRLQEKVDIWAASQHSYKVIPLAA